MTYLSNRIHSNTDRPSSSDSYPFLIPHNHKKNAKTLRQTSEFKKISK